MAITHLITICAFVTLSTCATTYAGNDVTPGDLIVEPSTLHCLGFEWPISGDDNRNAVVNVEYRAAGSKKWRPAQSLLRIGGEKVAGVAGWQPYITPHMFAGSVFNLKPGKRYNVRLTMSDPDGGGKQEIVTVSTKPQPKWDGGGRIIAAKPDDDLTTAFRSTKPGDHLVLQGGTYRGPFDFSNHGGQPGKPIVIRAADGPKPIIEGTQTDWVVNIVGSNHLWFEGITFRDPNNGDGGHTKEGVVLLAGNTGHGYTPGATNLVVRYCTFEDFGVGVMAVDSNCKNYVITDNRFLGRQHWLAPKEMKNGDYTKHSYVAVWVAGSGHDVAYNHVRGFRDGINVASNVGKRGDKSKGPRAIDFYNNIITDVGDDFVEADYGVHNIRIMNNLCLNTQTCGISAQPVYGGPAYFIGNILYNGPRNVALKFNVHPSGLVVYHNTFAIAWTNLVPWSNGHFRNNLFMEPVKVATLTDYSSFDYNGFAAPAALGDGERKNFADLTRTRNNQPIKNSYGVFEKLTSAMDREHTYQPDELNFTLRPNGAPVDAGTLLPNINDDYVGNAPDLGAMEYGGPSKHFGPRPR